MNPSEGINELIAELADWREKRSPASVKTILAHDRW
jgi:hypothetical protein